MFNDGTYIRLTEMVLVAHQRREDSNCTCGKLKVGDSWAYHVAVLLNNVGALKEEPPSSV